MIMGSWSNFWKEEVKEVYVQKPENKQKKTHNTQNFQFFRLLKNLTPLFFPILAGWTWGMEQMEDIQSAL